MWTHPFHSWLMFNLAICGLWPYKALAQTCGDLGDFKRKKATSSGLENDGLEDGLHSNLCYSMFFPTLPHFSPRFPIPLFVLPEVAEDRHVRSLKDQVIWGIGNWMLYWSLVTSGNKPIQSMVWDGFQPKTRGFLWAFRRPWTDISSVRYSCNARWESWSWNLGWETRLAAWETAGDFDGKRDLRDAGWFAGWEPGYFHSSTNQLLQL